jgi:hypothetical protein
MLARLRDFPGMAASYIHDGREHPVPRVELVFLPESGIDSHQLVLAMENHNPRIFLFEPTGPSAKPNSIVINTQTMQPGEEKIVAEALAGAIGARLRQPVAAVAG